MSDIKKRAIEIYQEHIALAATDGRLFRKTVREQLMAETGCSEAGASTHYNNCKKASAPIEGLGRAPVPKGVCKPGSKDKPGTTIQDDDECFTVMEVIDDEVCRTESFHMQGDASEAFDSKIELWPRTDWVMIEGIGPNSGDKFKISHGEREIKRYSKETVTVA